MSKLFPVLGFRSELQSHQFRLIWWFLNFQPDLLFRSENKCLFSPCTFLITNFQSKKFRDLEDFLGFFFSVCPLSGWEHALIIVLLHTITMLYRRCDIFEWFGLKYSIALVTKFFQGRNFTPNHSLQDFYSLHFRLFLRKEENIDTEAVNRQLEYLLFPK